METALTGGSALAKVRETMGVSQRAFADMADVSQSHISDVERGIVRPCPRLEAFLLRLNKWTHEAVMEGVDTERE